MAAYLLDGVLGRMVNKWSLIIGTDNGSHKKTINTFIKQKLDPLYKEIEGTFSLDESEKFARLIQEFGKKNSFTSLNRYGTMIIQAIESMDFNNIEKYVLMYPEIYEMVKNDE